MKLQAGALSYAMVVALLVGMVCTSLVLLAGHYRELDHRVLLRYQLTDDSYSGLQLLLANPDLAERHQEQPLDLYEDGLHPVWLTLSDWGAWQVAKATTRRSGLEHQRMAMTGHHIPLDSAFALYVSDQNQPLRLTGKTQIKGDCFLPKAGVKRAYVEGKSFFGTKLIEGRQRTASRFLPPPPPPDLPDPANLIAAGPEGRLMWIDIREDSLVQSFAGDPLNLWHPGELALVDEYLLGQIRIVSGGQIFVGASAQLRDVILCAPTVVFEAGFEGQVQVIARDSIIVARDCQLNYPSLLLLAPETNNTRGSIRLKEGCSVSGVVCLQKELHAPHDQNIILMEEGSEVEGLVYSNRFLELRGTITGSAIAQRLRATTGSSNHQNLLIDATIDRMALNENWTGPLSGEGNNRIVQWLY